MTPAREKELRALVHLLARVLRAEGLVVWEVEPSGLTYAFGHDTPKSALSRGLEAWELQQHELSRGRTVEFEGHTFRPAFTSDRRLAVVVQSVAYGEGATTRERLDLDAQDEGYVERRLRSLVTLLRAPDDEPPVAGDDVVIYTAARLDKPAGRLRVRAIELTAALRRARWNIAQTARQFGVTPQTVRNWMRALGLRRLVPSPFDPRVARGRRA